MLNSYLGDALVTAGTVAGALAAIAMLLRKFSGAWRTSGTETSLVTLLHSELTRLSSHNTKLMQELEKLQTEVIKLSGEMYKLTQENRNLHSEVSRLTMEVSRLQLLIREYQSTSSIKTNAINEVNL
jgi:chromosome segregation ATPase